MIRYKVIDNFLSDSDFNELTNNILPPPVNVPGSHFVWMYTNKQVYPEYEPERLKKVTKIEPLKPLNQWLLSHLLWEGGYRSPAFDLFGRFIEEIEPIGIWRIKANLTVQQEKRERSLFHIDYINKPFEHTSMITSIFYMNTTNGPTVLEDGTEIECRENRLVSFPYDTYHAGVSCTDHPYRISINLNYFKDMSFLYE